MWCQQGSAPAHFGNNVREYLGTTFVSVGLAEGVRGSRSDAIRFLCLEANKKLVYFSTVEIEIELVGGEIVQIVDIIHEENIVLPLLHKVSTTQFCKLVVCLYLSLECNK